MEVRPRWPRTRAKRAGGMVQVVEQVPSKLETLSSNPSQYHRRKERE
jgi:hypothetical protein